MHFVTIGTLGNCSDIAKIANDFCCEDAFGDGKGGQPLVIGNIGKIVMPFKLARPHTDRPLQYKIKDNIANSPTIVLQIKHLPLAIISNLTVISWAIHAF